MQIVNTHFLFQYTTDSLRHLVAEYMQLHQDDFLPFLANQETGDPYTEGTFM